MCWELGRNLFVSSQGHGNTRRGEPWRLIPSAWKLLTKPWNYKADVSRTIRKNIFADSFDLPHGGKLPWGPHMFAGVRKEISGAPGLALHHSTRAAKSDSLVALQNAGRWVGLAARVKESWIDYMTILYSNLIKLYYN